MLTRADLDAVREVIHAELAAFAAALEKHLEALAAGREDASHPVRKKAAVSRRRGACGGGGKDAGE